MFGILDVLVLMEFCLLIVIILLVLSFVRECKYLVEGGFDKKSLLRELVKIDFWFRYIVNISNNLVVLICMWYIFKISCLV